MMHTDHKCRDSMPRFEETGKNTDILFQTDETNYGVSKSLIDLDMNCLKDFRNSHIGIEEALMTFKLVHVSLLRLRLLINVPLGNGITIKARTCILNFVNNRKQVNGIAVSIPGSVLLTAS